MSDRRRIAPWIDAENNTLHEGDRLRHPNGECGTIIYLIGADDPWRVRYDDDPINLSRLQLQIGKGKGCAVLIPQLD